MFIVHFTHTDPYMLNLPLLVLLLSVSLTAKADDYLEKESNYTVRAGASRGAAYDTHCPQWGEGL